MATSDGTVEAAPAESSLRAGITVIAVALFATTFGWPGLIGRLPFGLMLKNSLHLPAQRVAAFWGLANLAWYAKPAIGLLCDAVPLFGTRRRAYLIVGGLAATAMWLAFAAVPASYAGLLGVMIALNLALVVVSTVMGGMLVETGQRYGASGRLSAMREGLTGVMQLVAGPYGGWLASRAFGWTIGAGAAVALTIVPTTLLLVREPRGARVDHAALATARAQLREIVRSRAMWAAAGLTFLVYVSPGFQTPLLYFQQDVLEFDAQFMGWLDLVAGAAALLGAVAYGVLCRRVPLRVSLVLGIALNAASSLFYLALAGKTSAFVINATAGVLAMLGILPLFDLAVRATPKGSESFGYSLIMSVRNLAIFGVSDVVGSWLYDGLHWSFYRLVWVNALSSAAVLIFVPMLPRALLAPRDGAPST
ncbi:MAG TPA: MFS transporter [Polyangia bacterium]|nr:MFS transporter [Polyangia bacterium]